MNEYRCNIRNAPIDGWEWVEAETPYSAACIYYHLLSAETQAQIENGFIYVLNDDENPGVCKPAEFETAGIRRQG